MARPPQYKAMQAFKIIRRISRCVFFAKPIGASSAQSQIPLATRNGPLEDRDSCEGVGNFYVALGAICDSSGLRHLGKP